MGADGRYGLVTAPPLGGVERLWQNKSLTINGVTKDPEFWFDGTTVNATAKTWTCRQTGTIMALAGAGAADPGFAEPTPTGEKGVLFSATSKCFKDPGVALGDIDTSDCIVEIVVRTPLVVDGGYDRVLDKLLTNTGWNVFARYNILVFQMQSAAPATVTVDSATIPTGAWVHGFFVIDRSNIGRCYNNGVAGVDTTVAGLAADLSCAISLFCGNNTTDARHYRGAIALVAMWKGAAWLDTHVQDALAKQRFALLTGHYAQHSHAAQVPVTL